MRLADTCNIVISLTVKDPIGQHIEKYKTTKMFRPEKREVIKNEEDKFLANCLLKERESSVKL